MNHAALVESYFKLYAYESDTASWARLTSLMRRVNKHRASCVACKFGTCSISLRRALRIEVKIESIIVEGTLQSGSLMMNPQHAARIAAVARERLVRLELYPAP